MDAETRNLELLSWVCLLLSLAALCNAIWPVWSCIQEFPTHADHLVQAGVLEEESVLFMQGNETSIRYICWRAYPVHREQGSLLFFLIALMAFGGLRVKASKLAEDKKKILPKFERPIERDPTRRTLPIPQVTQDIPDSIEVDEEFHFGAHESFDEDSSPSLMEQIQDHQRAFQTLVEESTLEESSSLSTVTPDGFYCPPGYDGTARLYVDPSSLEATDRYLLESERVHMLEKPFATITAAIDYACALIKRHNTPVQVRLQPAVYQTSVSIPSRVCVVNHRMPADLGLTEQVAWMMTLKEVDHQDRVTILPTAEDEHAVLFEPGGHMQGLYGCHLVSREGTQQRGVFASRTTDMTLMCCTIEGFKVGGARFEVCGRQEPGFGSRLLGVVFKRNMAADGGGLYISDSVCRLERCLFQDNEAFRGGGMYVERLSTPLELGRCEFRNNLAKTARRPQDLIEVKFSTCSTLEGIGGGLCGQRAQIRAMFCHFFENGASVAGGGVGIVGGRLILGGGKDAKIQGIKECKARWGGALFAMGWRGNDGVIKVKDLDLRHNVANYKGGAICLLGKVTMQAQGMTLYMNRCAKEGSMGGGMMVWAGAHFMGNCVTIQGNAARLHGGGVAARNATVRFKGNSVFQDNKVDDGAAGGLFFESVKESQLEERAQSGDLVFPFKLHLVKTEFVANTAAKGASAVFVGSMSKLRSFPIELHADRASIVMRSNRFKGADRENNDTLIVWAGARVYAGRCFPPDELRLD